MLFVKVPKEIKDYQEKMIVGLSTRQLCWGVLAIIASLLCYFGVGFIVGSALASWVTMFVGIPLFACGFVDYQGMPMSKFLKITLKYYTKNQILLYDNGYPRKEREYYDKKKKSRKEIKHARRERKILKENQKD